MRSHKTFSNLQRVLLRLDTYTFPNNTINGPKTRSISHLTASPASGGTMPPSNYASFEMTSDNTTSRLTTNTIHRQYSSTPYWSLSSPFSKNPAENTSTPTTAAARKKKKFIPRKAAVTLTERARTFFKALLENSPDKAGVILNYNQASSGQPRMVFSFGFVTKDQLTPDDEGVSLEVLEDGTPKSPRDAIDDGLPKLYVHHNAFMKVLGATVDVNMEDITPILYDREGNLMDPNFYDFFLPEIGVVSGRESKSFLTCHTYGKYYY